MKIEYKGYEIEAKREKSITGEPLLFSGVYRICDGYECMCCYENSSETIRDSIKYLKERIDEEHLTDDPWEEKEESKLL